MEITVLECNGHPDFRGQIVGSTYFIISL